MNLNKRILIILLLLLTNIKTQDIAGNFRLSGLGAVYYDFVRQETNLIVTDNYELGLNPVGDTYLQGELVRYEYQVPSPEDFLNTAGVTLYVNFYDDGSAAIAQGSTYPTSTTENCISSLSTLPVTGDQGYSSNLNSGALIPEIDIVGLTSKSLYAGQNSGSCSITSSPVFDVFPQQPTDLTIPFPINTESLSEELGQQIPANTILPGKTAGYAIYDYKMISTIERNSGTRPSLYLEWHAMDGPVNDSGLGDIIGEDEDGDGTDYDTIYGLENIRIMKIKLECGDFSYPIAGRNLSGLESMKEQQCENNNLSDNCSVYASNWIDNCIDNEYIVASGNDVNNLYVFDTNASSTTWGGLLTWNSINGIQEDDSNEDYDDSCRDDGDVSDCQGRLTFSYSPQCVPSFSIRYFMAELTEICEESNKDECGICGGNGPVKWYNDHDRDGLGDPNNYRTNCLPGYCLEDENLSKTECTDIGNTWNWLSLGNCSDGNGNIYENLSPTLGDFEFCNYLIENDIPGYENATWVWDRSFSTNNNDPDDSCENIDVYHNCDGHCFNDFDNDNICDEIDSEPNCPTNDTDECGECGGNGVPNGTCNCNGDLPLEFYNCDGTCIADSDLDEICDELEILGCTNPEAINYNSGATEDNETCNFLSNNELITPNEFTIKNIYPNPFNPIVSIKYSTPVSQFINANIYNLNGEHITTLVSEFQSSGNYSIKWNATGRPSGIYIITIDTNTESISQKLLFLK